MAYVQGTRFDVFLSYAHGNDVLRAWSLNVMSLLRSSIEILLADRERQIEVFTDEARLQGNGYVDTQLSSAVQSSAAIVIVMSGYYVKSEWCRQEAEWFQAAAAADPSVAERIFVIRATNVPDEDWPGFLRTNGAADGTQIKGYDFCDKGEDQFPYGLHGQQDDQLGTSVARMSRELCQFMRRRRKAAAAPTIPAAPAGPPRPRVLLGICTEDLEPEREAIRARLAASGRLDVLAPAMPEDSAGIEKLIQAALPTCGGIVQLCGRASGRWSRSADGFVAHQVRAFESAHRESWLVSAPGANLDSLSTSVYAEFLAERRARLRPEPDAAAILAALAPAPNPGRVPSGVVYINSRVQYEAAESALRSRISQLGRDRVVDARVMPVPPLFRIANPEQLTAIIDVRRRNAADIRADLLIFTDRVDLFNDDLFVYIRDAQGLRAPRPAAVVDASSTPGLTRDDAGGYDVFRLDDPGFDTKMGAWLQACLDQGARLGSMATTLAGPAA